MIDTHTITSLSLASALLTMGAELVEPPSRIKTEKGETLTFTFREEGGPYRTSALIKAWHNDEFSEKNPEHPFAYVREAFKTRYHILENIHKLRRTVIIRRGNKIAIIPDNAPNREQILGFLPQS